MIDIYLDKSRSARLRARVNEASVPRVFKFFNSDGTPHDISSLDFKFFLFIRANSTKKLFTLTEGDGLTVGGDDDNELTISISNERSRQTADTYYWSLWAETEDHTWMNGPFEFNDNESYIQLSSVSPGTISIGGFDYELDFEFETNIEV